MPSSLLSALASIFRCASLRLRPKDRPANSGSSIYQNPSFQTTENLQNLLGRDPESSIDVCSLLSSTTSFNDIDRQKEQSTLFATLPSELVIQIFCQLDRFSTAWALAKASRRLDCVFTLNSNAILRDVASRSLQAQQLASAQELATLHQQSLSIHPATAQNRKHRILSDANAALKALSHYETCVLSSSQQEDHEHLSRHQLTPAEQIAFLRAYYRAMALVTLGQPRIPLESLERLDMLEYLQMREVTMLLTPVRKWQNEIELGIKFPHVSSRQNGCKNGFTSPFAPVSFPIDETLVPVVNWEETLLSLSCIEGCLLQHSACYSFHRGGPKPFFYFTLFDGYQKEASPTRGPKLGELICDMFNQHRILSDVVEFADGPHDTA